VALDGHRRQARGAFNQRYILQARAARVCAVHLQRSQNFVLPANDVCGTKLVQAKKICGFDNIGQIFGIAIWQRNQRNHVADLRIQGLADLMQHFRKRHAPGNRIEQSFFRLQQILNLRGRMNPSPALFGSFVKPWLPIVHLLASFPVPT